MAISQTIVNIEELRNEGKEGFFAGLGFSLNASRGNRAVSYTHLRAHET